MSRTPNITIILKLRARPHVYEMIGAPVMAARVFVLVKFVCSSQITHTFCPFFLDKGLIYKDFIGFEPGDLNNKFLL